MPYVAGPRYPDNPYSPEQHSYSFCREQCAYDLKNTNRATIVGEHTAGDANGSSGEIALGYHFSVFIPDSQPRSPITTATGREQEWNRTFLQPTTAPDALVTAYKLAPEV